MKRFPTLAKALAAGAALTIVTIVGAPPSMAAPTLEVSQLTGLKDGQTVTVKGSGFKPGLSGIAVGQCIDGMTGPKDCNLPNGSTFRTADASGSIGEFTIVVNEKFGANDCATTKCVIGAQPLPGAVDAATLQGNLVYHDISFGEVAAAPAPSAPAVAPTTAATTTAPTDSTLPKTGGGDSLPVVVLAGSALVLGGLGVMVAMPSRRRVEVR